MKVITLLHEKINNSYMTECLELMGLGALGDEDIEKLSNVLIEMKNELMEEEIKKSK